MSRAAAFALLMVAILAVLPAVAPAGAQHPAMPISSEPMRPGLQPQGPLTIVPAFAFQDEPVLVTGLAARMLVSLANPTDGPVNGTIRLSPTGAATLNLTTIDYRLDAYAFLSWPVEIVVDGEAGGFTAESDAPAARADFSARTVALTLSAVSPERDVTTGADLRPAFLATLTNHGSTPVAGAVVLLLQEARVAERALDPPLEPGASRRLDFGEHVLKPPGELFGRDPSNFAVMWRLAHVTDDRTDVLYDLRTDEGRVSSLLPVVGILRVTGGPSVELTVERAVLGGPSAVVARVRNNGPEASLINVRISVDSPLLRVLPEWRIPVVEDRILLRSGETREIRHEFVPRVAVDLNVESSVYDDGGHQSASAKMAFASPVRMTPVETPAVIQTSLGERFDWRLRVDAETAMPDGVLRIALAPAFHSTYDGLVRQDDLLGLTLDGAPVGGFAVGAPQTFGIRMDARASGTYLVVPYVASGGIAYPGAIDFAEWERSARASGQSFGYAGEFNDFLALTVLVMPDPVAPVLALVPGVVLLAGTAGLWVGRKLKVR